MPGARIFAPGAIANDKGDLFGSSPFRFLRHGKIILEVERVPAALEHGWRVLPKTQPDCDDDFAWMERTAAERDAQ